MHKYTVCNENNVKTCIELMPKKNSCRKISAGVFLI